MEYYATSLQHILAELERIDLLIQVQLQRLQHNQSTDTAFQGLYISEDDLEELLAKPIGQPRWATATTPFTNDEVKAVFEELSTNIRERKAASTARRKSKVKSQKSKSLCCQLFPDCEWYLYLRRAVLVSNKVLLYA